GAEQDARCAVLGARERWRAGFGADRMGRARRHRAALRPVDDSRRARAAGSGRRPDGADAEGQTAPSPVRVTFRPGEAGYTRGVGRRFWLLGAPIPPTEARRDACPPTRM